MTGSDMLTADQAKGIALDANTSRTQVMLMKISSKIETAAKEGRRSVMVSGDEDETVIQILENKGYKVEWTTCQKDGDDYHIEW